METPDTARNGTLPSDLASPPRYLSYYGLEAAPFRASTDPRWLWVGPTHQGVLDILAAAIRGGDGICLLTGDVGTGKTTLANRLGDELRAAGLLVGRVHHPGLDLTDFFQTVLGAFGVAREIHTRPEFLAAFRKILERAASSHRKTLLVIDEAQKLSEPLLREIQELSAIATPDGHGLALLLVGQTELRARLSQEGSQAVRLKIAAECSLAPLQSTEVAAYIRHALATAGTEKEVFSAQAIEEIASFSRGAPGAVSIICDRALLLGEVRRARPISRSIVQDCCRNPASPGAGASRPGRERRHVHLLGAGRGAVFSQARRRLGLAVALPATVLLIIGAQSLLPSSLDGFWRTSSRRPVPSSAMPPLADAVHSKPAAAVEAVAVKQPPETVPAVSPSLPVLSPPPSALAETPAVRAAPTASRPAEVNGKLSARVKSAVMPAVPQREAVSRPESRAARAESPGPKADVTATPSPALRQSQAQSESPDPSAVIDWLVRNSRPDGR